LTLVSSSTAGTSRRTIEAAVIKATFPSDPLDPRLQTVSGLERLATGITQNATNSYAGATTIANYGSPSQFGVAVVNGDCTFGPGTGYGLLLVRGQLTISGAYAWTGLIVVIGQGVVQWGADAIGHINGGLFAAQTRDIAGNLLAAPAGTTYTETDAAVIAQANASFPYIAIAIREY
jgi:hypothetical protein